MEKISFNEFLFKQPSFPERTATDMFYLAVANKLLDTCVGDSFCTTLPETVLKRLSIGLAGYLQDIVADAGIWRSFVDANRKLYGYTVPFHHVGEGYIDYELNAEDVRFLVWYTIAMTCEDLRDLYPLDTQVISLADKLFDILSSVYDEAPVPEGYSLAHGLDLHDPEDAEKIYHLGNWLFLHCYLTTPAFALTLSEIMMDTDMMMSKDVTRLQSRMEQSMMEDPTGPLALFVPEWVRLLIDGSLPDSKAAASDNVHPYYAAFTAATGGKELAYFGSYDEMNRFFIDKMGWDRNEEHLPVMKNETGFVIMVNRRRGMLVARNVARCIADPDNPYYDKDYASGHAFDFLSVRGRCPADLVKYVCSRGWLPDASFPHSGDTDIIVENWDFVARCYLQQYYRD